jgi:hypothetical protein
MPVAQPVVRAGLVCPEPDAAHTDAGSACYRRRDFDQLCRKSMIILETRRIKTTCGPQVDGPWSVNLGAAGQTGIGSNRLLTVACLR